MNIYSSNLILFLGTLLITLSACGQQNADDKMINNNTAEVPAILKTEQAWKSLLSKEQYAILRQKETERPFSGKLLYNNKKGIYTCAGCGSELFSSDMKFDAHCGWPSFDNEISGNKIKKIEDRSHGMIRTEIVCSACNGHLGHLFDDGPNQSGKRYCVNSLSLNFKENIQKTPYDTITLGGGCYWCVEAVYEKLDGVIDVVSGFSGGSVANPTYQEVCMEKTGHAEVVQIVFDPSKTSATEILQVFFTVHDPTTYHRQGADIGAQYRSVIFYHNPQQYKIARDLVDEFNKKKVYDNPVLTEIEPFRVFYAADEEHQNYYMNNSNKPYCKMVIQPKLDKFEKIFKDRLRKKAH
jgi:peptide methionine sulfoxide reductase msrA/msrB